MSEWENNIGESDELSSLYDKGFYICKVVWTAKAPKFSSDLYELEAQFSNPEECQAFSYMVRGVYKFNSSGKYNQTRNGIHTIDEIKFSKLIEKAAKEALYEIKATFQKGISNASK